MASIGALLLDIDGHLTRGVGGPAYEGGPEAVRSLARSLPLRYVTNATSRTRSALEAALEREGYPVEEGSVVTPTSVARQALEARDEGRGVLLADESTRADLTWFAEVDDPREARAVLVASECHDRRIDALRPAVEALRAGAALVALQANRVFRRDGRLETDLGPVVAFLAYAADVSWEVFGKPSRRLFETVARDLGVGVASLAMCGDDAEFDVAGALRAGLGAGILVRSGKYEPGDEERVSPVPSAVVDSIADLPALIDRLRA